MRNAGRENFLRSVKHRIGLELVRHSCLVLAAGWCIGQGVCGWSSGPVWAGNDHRAEKLRAAVFCVCRFWRGTTAACGLAFMLPSSQFSNTVENVWFGRVYRMLLLWVRWPWCFESNAVAEVAVELQVVHVAEPVKIRKSSFHIQASCGSARCGSNSGW